MPATHTSGIQQNDRNRTTISTLEQTGEGASKSTCRLCLAAGYSRKQTSHPSSPPHRRRGECRYRCTEHEGGTSTAQVWTRRCRSRSRTQTPPPVEHHGGTIREIHFVLGFKEFFISFHKNESLAALSPTNHMPIGRRLPYPTLPYQIPTTTIIIISHIQGCSSKQTNAYQ